MSMQAMASSGKAPTKIILGMMIFPLFMALAYPIMFLTAYHDPTPKDMDLAVIETTKDAGDIAHSIEVKGDGSLHVQTVAKVQDGKKAVVARQVRAAYNPKNGDLYTATAGGKQASMSAQQVFQKVADQQKKTLHTHDLVPTNAKDILGSGFMYMVMIGMITGYMSALMLNMLGRHLGLWRQLAVLSALAVGAGVIVTTTTYRFYQLYDHHIVQSGLIVAGLFMTVATVQLGLARLFGQISSFFGIAVWIILGVPSSGLTVSPDMMYGFFRVIYKFHPLAAGGDLMRSNLYFHGQGVGNDIILLAAWLVVGVGLLWLSTLRSPDTPAAVQDQVENGPDAPVPARGQVENDADTGSARPEAGAAVSGAAGGAEPESADRTLELQSQN